MAGPTVAPIFRGWAQQNERLVEALRPLGPEELSLPIGSPSWPVWASAAHLASMRPYWLCSVFGEPGAATTPFQDPTGFGWEDDLDHPREADELVFALESTWRIVQRCLDTWTVDSLEQQARRTRDGVEEVHTRQSVLLRMVTHDAYHCGEISLVLGSNGLGEIDLWRGLARLAT